MATFRRFEEIEAWQKARELVRKLYAASNAAGFARDFALRDQTRRAGISVMGNIAEGFERGGTREFLQFLAVAKASAGELRSHLYVALDQGYVDKSVFEELSGDASEVAHMIGGLMNYLRQTPRRGPKFDQREKP